MSTIYKPPANGAAILERQDERDSLRLLLAQRRLYSSAKRLLGVRWIGMLGIGLGAPVVAVVWPNLAVAVGAIAGGWIFLSRTAIQAGYLNKSAGAAAIQEQFDVRVYGMPTLVPRKVLPSREEIASLVGPDVGFDEAVRKEQLEGWYSVDDDVDGAEAVAICQRENVSYSDHLLRTTSWVWGVSTAAWVVALLALGALRGLSQAQFLLGVLLPVLPAALDVVEHVLNLRRAAQGRRDVARSIESALSEGSVDPEQLLVWQDELFAVRRATPEVPDFVYAWRRRKNEATMHAVAGELSAESRHRNAE